MSNRRIDDDPGNKDYDRDQKGGESKVVGNKLSRDDDIRRNLRWVAFTKPRAVFGFDHLSPITIPTHSGLRGFAITFEKITGFSIPSTFIGHAFSIQLSFSFFHIKSQSFFGSTWLSFPVDIPADSPGDAVSIVDIDINDIIYFVSRLTDPACVGVVEIVASLQSSAGKVPAGQYGCGWTMLNCFSSTSSSLSDIADGEESIITTSFSLFTGSPRDLIMYSDLSTLSKELAKNELSNCSLEVKMMAHKRLLKAQRLIAENEVLGRFDVIPGLKSNYVTPPGMVQARSVPCIGDEERIDKRGANCLFLFFVAYVSY